ncbi:D-malate dehydrogenase [decarboxylating] [Phaeobacter italicus]|uniref:D-malate dehydrogenase [decarboxylating] n=1 Tax=Phaeobacter italicus TaxID=481446 RepID=A0A0H5DJC3_9RHOB|nr:tartrate dehydrogenase [Phaeobacter italicus]CRL12820.1 D-malate dehydrogenase [decarboxylating] [Phaeobacter italicus]
MTKTYRIAAIPGDGIGKEVLPVGQRVIDLVAQKHGFTVEWTEFDWSCERYHETGRMMPEDGIEQMKAFDSIYLGAVGFPGVPDHVSLWGLLIPLRRELDQYANVRPVRLLNGINSPLAGRGSDDIDMIIVRENVEGEYSEIGGRVYQGTEHEAAIQESILTRRGTDRIMDYAFNVAKTRKRKHVSSATKSNGIIHTMPFWDERFAAAAERHPGIGTAQFHIDIMTANFVLHPDWFDVVVASNLFGDILSDLGPAVAGSIGIAPSANINPEGKYPSMFEPVHGSAPDIAGKGVANPVAAVWTAAMMLEHLGESGAAADIERAIETSLERADTKTRDLGGTADTAGSEAAILAALS